MKRYSSLDVACFHVWTRLPYRLQDTRFGLWLLARAGRYAFDESHLPPGWFAGEAQAPYLENR